MNEVFGAGVEVGKLVEKIERLDRKVSDKVLSCAVAFYDCVTLSTNSITASTAEVSK